MDWTHIAFAALAGAGGGLAWGYRTALNVALGREGVAQAPRQPRGPDGAVLAVPHLRAREGERERA